MSATQRIIRVRRQYNQWVANETFEDYALRFTATSARRWSHARVANTAVGSISFLALEAIGGIATLHYGFVNAVAAILVVSALIFATSTSVGYYAARYGLDIDLLTRGAGFGYIGSTVSSLIYAVFTFIFFAIEAAIMAVALEMGLGLPLSIGYVVSALVILPFVMYGSTLINRLQFWTQPVWVLLQVLPFIAIAVYAPQKYGEWAEFAGLDGSATGFQFALFGAAASIVFALMGQIGEQADFLRFMPPKKPGLDWRWWGAVLAGGPGWILVGGAKMLAGSLLAVLAVQHGLTLHYASEPVEMYRIGFGFVFDQPQLVVFVTVLFVVLSQIKINVTNAYAGSIAWSNFFARLTHSHPGRIVWLVFNVAIALLLMEMGVYRAFDHILAIYSNLAVAWIGALVADLVVNKRFGLSPPGIEFKRAYLPDINPVGYGAMTLASIASLIAFSGVLGPTAKALAGFIGLFGSFGLAVAIAYLTRGRYYLARTETPPIAAATRLTCCICQYEFEHPDMAQCPAYGGPICSLCCTLDARCGDRCKPGFRLDEQIAQMLAPIAPKEAVERGWGRLTRYGTTFAFLTLLVASVVAFGYMQGAIAFSNHIDVVRAVSWNVFWLLIIVGGISTWMIVLGRESRVMAQEESERQTVLLIDEIEAHERTDAALQESNAELKQAKEQAESANLAKSRYTIGISHELRSPLNAVLGYAQILGNDPAIPPQRQNAIQVVRRSAEHMSSLIDGLLDISKIEAGRLYLQRDELDLRDLLEQMADMFRLQASAKGIEFRFEVVGNLPVSVYGDGRRIRQVFINLLSNAVKFTQSGHVLFRVRYRGMFADIDVIDTGSGIHADDQQRVFEPFERGNNSDTAPIPGTGLGLTITRLLVSVMGGQLTLDSTPGIGSTFHVRLLLSEVTYPAAMVATPKKVSGYAGERRSVLVADDDASHSAIIAEILVPLGFEVETVASGPACIVAAERSRPDLVVLDITMPGMSGWDVARILREAVSPQSRILIASGNAFEIEARHGMMAYHDAALVKPIEMKPLLQAVSRLLDLRWTAARPASAEPSMVPGTATRRLPNALELADLRRLGEIGYVRGIKDKLSDIEAQSEDYRWVVDLLTPLISHLDFPGFIAAISDLLKNDGAHETT